MSDAEWDADDFEPNFVIKPVKGKWDDEDEEEDVKDNWDEDEEETEKTTAAPTVVQLPVAVTAPTAKKGKNLRTKIAKKELEQEKKLIVQQKSPEQSREDKLRWEKEQKEGDLALALEALGLDRDAAKNSGEIDSFEPRTKDDFTKFASLLTQKIENYKNSPFYINFLENLFRDLVVGVDIDGMKKISSGLTVMYNEKLKLTKAKPKKKATKAKLNMGREGDIFNEDDNDYIDDDFM